ncbi:DUF4232 domain-containing protein [Streptomyces sp. MUM 203J]|uniref:DUF4232 domain-containing protein n=1 Tax=Streptomyces sp. MUM 203J TaxID=2791990 RepID=UPI001F03470D|nr:DUF4232 domain-containing protein [Streptomyces sp. MUM 203J]MCH0540896.1 DUF4232 domain-containing protein [Streptomyces sp. MUM 203J]
MRGRKTAVCAAVAAVLAIGATTVGCDAADDGAAEGAGPATASPSGAASDGAGPDGVSAEVRPSGAVGAPCPESGVRVSPDGASAALGWRAVGVELENCGTRPFEVSGYPEVEVLDGDGEALDVTTRLGGGTGDASDGGAEGRSTFTLKPGERAAAGVQWRNTVTRSDIPATEGTFLRVRPGPGTPPQTITPEGGPVDLGNTGTVEVTPWKRADG